MNDWESVKELQALCGRLDFNHIYAQRKLLFISKLTKLNNDVMKVCYNNFRRSDECVRLQCEFDFAVVYFLATLKTLFKKRDFIILL